MSDVLKIIFLGQSGFLLEANGSKMLIDPQDRKSGDRDGDFVYCTHKHFDHTRGVKPFLKRNPEAFLIGNDQVVGNFSEFGVRTQQVQSGETFKHGPWKLEFLELRHGIFKSVHNLAVVVHIQDFVFIHCGDAVSFEGITDYSPDVLAVPICGGPAAKPSTILKILEEFKEPYPIVIPMHWLFRNPKKLCRKIHETFPEIRCIVPEDGEEINI
jgi:L-ascorbate metabolism protein UlaG (beta-lactamase superfamily)